jgi:hypothetical protein
LVSVEHFRPTSPFLPSTFFLYNRRLNPHFYPEDRRSFPQVCQYPSIIIHDMP